MKCGNSIELINDFMAKYNAEFMARSKRPEFVYREFKWVTWRWILAIEKEALNLNWIHLATTRDNETFKGNAETLYLTYKLWINPKELMVLELDKGTVIWHVFRDHEAFSLYLAKFNAIMIDTLKEAMDYPDEMAGTITVTRIPVAHLYNR
jgi:hypothetical protein